MKKERKEIDDRLEDGDGDGGYMVMIERKKVIIAQQSLLLIAFF